LLPISFPAKLARLGIVFTSKPIEKGHTRLQLHTIVEEVIILQYARRRVLRATQAITGATPEIQGGQLAILVLFVGKLREAGLQIGLTDRYVILNSIIHAAAQIPNFLREKELRKEYRSQREDNSSHRPQN
jgi:hypothetical protein